MSTLEIISSWGGPEDSFRVISSSSPASESWTAELRAVRDPGVVLRMEQTGSDPRITIRHCIPISPEIASLDAQHTELLLRTVATVGEGRSGTMRCEMSTGAAEVTISAVIYSDGLTRHCLNSTVEEMLKARNILNQCLSSFSDSLRGSREVQAQMEEQSRKAEEIFASLSQPRSFPEQPSEPQICPACGEPLNPGKPFCSSCGTRVA